MIYIIVELFPDLILSFKITYRTLLLLGKTERELHCPVVRHHCIYSTVPRLTLIGSVRTPISFIYYKYFKLVFLLFFKLFYALGTVVLHHFTSTFEKSRFHSQRVRKEQVYIPLSNAGRRVVADAVLNRKRFKSRHLHS